jgi:hypothetical protein
MQPTDNTLAVRCNAEFPAGGKTARGRDAGEQALEHDDGEPGRECARARRFQFSLRSLFVWTAAVCALLALVAQLSRPWSIAVVWMSVLVAAHVFANACGSKRLWGQPRRRESEHDEPAPVPIWSWSQMPDSTRLGRQARWSQVLMAATGLCGVIGAAVGVTVLWMGWLGPTGPSGLAMGGGSCAALGGFAGFLSTSFIEVAGGALIEAGSAGRPAAAGLRPIP